jgi:RNA polymerase sigma-70 factor (ECF subfamily)
MNKTPGAIKQLQRRGLIALRELVKEKDHTPS